MQEFAYLREHADPFQPLRPVKLRLELLSFCNVRRETNCLTVSDMSVCFDETAPLDERALSLWTHLAFCADCTAAVRLVRFLMREETTLEETILLNRLDQGRNRMRA